MMNLHVVSSNANVLPVPSLILEYNGECRMPTDWADPSVWMSCYPYIAGLSVILLSSFVAVIMSAVVTVMHTCMSVVDGRSLRRIERRIV